MFRPAALSWWRTRTERGHLSPFRRVADRYLDCAVKRPRSAVRVIRSPPCQDVQKAIWPQGLRWWGCERGTRHVRSSRQTDMVGLDDDVRSWGQSGPRGCAHRLPKLTQLRHEFASDLFQLQPQSSYSCFPLNGNDPNGSLALDFEFAQRLAFEAIPDLKPSFIGHRDSPGIALPAMRAAILTVSPQISNW
jgi:hypothetical protein